MESKPDKHATPKSKIDILRRPLSKGVAADSPFRNMPNFSTPPSRFAKILNPFESHLMDQLHLPTFSPTVFQQNLSPKTEANFKWTIDDISSLKPAEIDETTVSQHVTMEDSATESLVQQKIEKFFMEKAIVPSPLNVKIPIVPSIRNCDNSILGDNHGTTPVKGYVKETCEETTQTVLTLPPVLPADLEEALKPYFKYSEDQMSENCAETSLYRKLFEFDSNHSPSKEKTDNQSVVSSPAISSGLSPIQFSPGSGGIASPFEMPELKDCNLSPICKTSPKIQISKSACRLNFSEKMNVDKSLVVPDLDKDSSYGNNFSQTEEEYHSSGTSVQENNLSGNWSMEYKQMSVDPQCSSNDLMDISNSNTPNSKLYIGKGQRKRLSESFNKEEEDSDVNADTFCEDLLVKTRNKLFKKDLTDIGYCTRSNGDLSDANNHVFASTPSKRQYNLQV